MRRLRHLLTESLAKQCGWVLVLSPTSLGRDVAGKAVIIYSTFVPGGRSHSASDRAGLFGANTRASELGAAMIINIMAVPGNAQFNPLGAPSADYGVPLMTVSQDEGFALRDILGAGEQVMISLTLDIELRENVETAKRLCETAREDGRGDCRCGSYRRLLPGVDGQRQRHGERS